VIVINGSSTSNYDGVIIIERKRALHVYGATVV